MMRFARNDNADERPDYGEPYQAQIDTNVSGSDGFVSTQQEHQQQNGNVQSHVNKRGSLGEPAKKRNLIHLVPQGQLQHNVKQREASPQAGPSSSNQFSNQGSSMQSTSQGPTTMATSSIGRGSVVGSTQSIVNMAASSSTMGAVMGPGGVPLGYPGLVSLSSKRDAFYAEQKDKVDRMSEEDFRNHCRHMTLPMARVKKIMKIDEDLDNLMISSDAPLLLSAVAEMFVEEATLMSWHVVDESRRKTMQKADVVNALTRDDTFDFLIDILPREEPKPATYNFNNSTTQLQTVDLPAGVQYVVADPATLGENQVYQLPDGEVLHATPIGQPIPIGSSVDQMSNLPAGMQLMQLPPEPVSSQAQQVTHGTVQRTMSQSK